MSIFIEDINMPTEYGICITIFPDGRVTGEFSEMVIGHAVDGETIMPCDKKGEKHEKWIDDGALYDDYPDHHGNHIYRCSKCGECYIDYGMGWNYCPNCGAKMDIEEEGA